MMQESKEVTLHPTSRKKEYTIKEVYQVTQEPIERALNEQNWTMQQNKVVLDYKLKYKINLHTDINKWLNT